MQKRLRYEIYFLLMLAFSFALAMPLHAQDTPKCDLQTESDYVDRGDTKESDGDYQGAIDDYNCALELNASNTSALFGRAYSYAALGDTDRAERDYTKLLELDPENGAAYNNRANFYYSAGDYDRARADYDRAIELDEKNNDSDVYIPYANRGNLSYDQGNYQDALDDLDKAIELSPTYRAPYLTRAFVHQKLGDNKAAQADIQSWLENGETKHVDLNIATFKSGSTLDMSQGWVYHILLDVQAGQTLRAAAKSEGDAIVDPMIILLDGDGTPVAWNDDSDGSLDSLLKYKFDEGGSYELMVTHAGGGSEGQFRLLLEVVSKG